MMIRYQKWAIGTLAAGLLFVIAILTLPMLVMQDIGIPLGAIKRLQQRSASWAYRTLS